MEDRMAEPAISMSANYHWVRDIRAFTHTKGCLRLTLCGDPDSLNCQLNEVDINVFMLDAGKIDLLVDAINGAIQPGIPEQSTNDAEFSDVTQL
jgi:hypothetical protein